MARERRFTPPTNMKRTEAFCGKCGRVKSRTEFSSMTRDKSRGDSPQFYCKECQRIAAANPKRLAYELYSEDGYVYSTAEYIPLDDV